MLCLDFKNKNFKLWQKKNSIIFFENLLVKKMKVCIFQRVTHILFTNFILFRLRIFDCQYQKFHLSKKMSHCENFLFLRNNSFYAYHLKKDCSKKCRRKFDNWSNSIHKKLLKVKKKIFFIQNFGKFNSVIVKNCPVKNFTICQKCCHQFWINCVIFF